MAAGILLIESADLSNRSARAKVILANPDLIRVEVVAELSTSVPRLVKSNRKKALHLAELAVLIAEKLDDTAAIAQSLRAKGNALHGLGRNKAAIEHHRKALQLFRIVGNPDQIARTLSTSIQPLTLLGQYDQAFAFAREARSIFSAQGDEWRLARLELNLGNIYDRRDRFEEALACYESAYRYLSLHSAADPEATGAALHNIAVSCIRLNDFRKARTVYEQARRFAAEHEMHVLVAQADYNIAWLHYLRGDYSNAISMLRRARENCRESGDQYHVGLCGLDLSEIYLELNLSREAEEIARHASAVFQRLGMQYERGKALANVAIALGQQGSNDYALKLFLQARRILVKDGNKVVPSLIDLYRAVVLFDAKRDADATRLCLAALKSFQRFKLANKAAICRLLLARIHLRGNRLAAAHRQCSSALKSARSLEFPVLGCQAEALLGQIEGKLDHDRLSYEAYSRAKELLEQLRNSIHGEELKISFMKDRVTIYQSLISLVLKQERNDDALKEVFTYTEQAKSRSLLDVLSTARSASWLAPQGRDKVARKLRDLREELNWYFHKIEIAQIGRASQHELTTLRTESRQRERELLKLLRERSPQKDESLNGQTATALSIDQIRQVLPADALILEYFQLQDRIVVLLLGHNQIKLVTLAKTAEVLVLLEQLQFQLGKLRLGAEYVKAFEETLHRSIQAQLQNLYKALVAPFRERLNASHLIIAPHGMLHNLPFHSLFDGAQYLIDEFVISYAPSASVFAVCQARSALAGGSSLVFGILDEALPFVEEEVKAAAASLPNSELFLGANATVECLRQKGPQSRFLHIATHGYFRKDSPMFSGILLGDSYFSLYDLYQLRLPAELVTLSGCSTGLNVVGAGDELLGLARGIIHAGAQSSLLTLWDVQDRSISRLMKHFYGQLASSRNKAHALQKAMHLLKTEHPHPYFWAPLVLIGKV